MSLNKKLSIIIPAYNEEENIIPTISKINTKLINASIPYEIIVVNDNSKDSTPFKVMEYLKTNDRIKLINRSPPGGFGRAIRTGLENFSGDVVIIVMADLSDEPEDIIKYYNKINEGYDCVYGTRFSKESTVTDYPWNKLVVNRLVNKLLQLLFLTKHNDLTNAFKAYNSYVIRSIQPLHACHFNITIELSLSALIRNYKIASIPINWYGRRWGASNLKLSAMGRRYLATLIKIWFEKILILDDLIANKQNTSNQNNK